MRRSLTAAALAALLVGAAGCGTTTRTTTSRVTVASGTTAGDPFDDSTTTTASLGPSAPFGRSGDAPELKLVDSGYTRFDNGELSWGVQVANPSTMDAAEVTVHVRLVDADGELIKQDLFPVGNVLAGARHAAIGGAMTFDPDDYDRIADAEFTVHAADGVPEDPLPWKISYRDGDRIVDGFHTVDHPVVINTGTTTIPEAAPVYLIYFDKRRRLIGGDSGLLETAVAPGTREPIVLDRRQISKDATRITIRLTKPTF